MRNKRWFVLVGVVVALLSFAVLVGACGDDEGDGGAEPTATEEEAEEPTATEEAAEEPTATVEEDGGAGTRLEVSAVDIAFEPNTLEAPADQSFTVVFDNQDEGLSHSFAIYENQEAAEGDDDPIAATDIASGPDEQELPVDALEAGEYFFWCEVHQGQMTGTLVVE